MGFPTKFELPAVVERELRVASRKPATYRGRATAGLTGLVVVGVVMTSQMAGAPVPSVGQSIFRLLAGMTALTVLASVLQSASEAFAREKREDTLGLLFLTPLRPVDIVLGKLVSTSLSAFYRFLAIVPVLAVPMLAGGVSVGAFLLLVLALMNLIFVGATLGLWVSAECWDERRAASWASSIMLAVVVLPALAGLNNLALVAFSPAYAVWQAVFPGSVDKSLLMVSLVWTQILGWTCFSAACRNLPHCWQSRPENLAPRGDHLRPLELKAIPQPAGAGIGPPHNAPQVRHGVRRHFSAGERTELLNSNPLAWFCLRWKSTAAGTWGIVVLGAIGFGLAIMDRLIHGDFDLMFTPAYALGVVFVVNMAIKTLAAHQAAFAFARDRGEDTLELLLATPITPRQLMDGHAHALRQTLEPVLRRALWIEAGWLAFIIGHHVLVGGADGVLYLLAAAAMLALLVPDVRALAFTAMWGSVFKKNAAEAQSEAVSRVAIAPWLFAGAVWSVVFSVGGERLGALALIASWTVAGIVADRLFTRQAIHQIETWLAVWAQRRSAGEFEHRDGWRHLGRVLGRWRSGRSRAARVKA